MNVERKYTFGDVLLSEQDLIFCRLLQMKFPPELAAEATKLRTHLFMHLTYLELGEAKAKQQNVVSYLQTAPPIPTPRHNEPYDLGTAYAKHSIEVDKVEQRPSATIRTYSIKKTAFCYLIALGFSKMFSAEIAMCGKTEASKRTTATTYLKDPTVLAFIAHLQYRLFKENKNSPDIDPQQLRGETLTIGSEEVREKLIALEVELKNLRTKFIDPLKRTFEYLTELENRVIDMQQQLTDLTETEGEDALW